MERDRTGTQSHRLVACELPGLLPPGRRCLWRANWTLGVWMYTPRPEVVVHIGCVSVAHGAQQVKLQRSSARDCGGSLPPAAWSGIVTRWIPGGRGSRFVSSVPLPRRRELPQGARRPGRAQGRGGARSKAARPPKFQPELRRPAEPERRWAASLSTIASPSAA